MFNNRNKSFAWLVLCYIWIFNSNIFVSTKELPVFLKNLRCSISNNYDKCYIENGNKAIPIMANGDPEYGIPNMKPLVIPFITLVSTPSFRINLTNAEIHGLDKMVIVNHKGDLEKGTVTVDLKGDNITVVGDYEAFGHILIMPLNGKGRFSMYLKNGEYRKINTMKVVEKDGDKYVELLDATISARFERIVFNLENLFDGNKQLGDQVNNFLNENWEILEADFGPKIGKTVSRIINRIYQSIASVVPIKNIFLP